MRVSTAPQLQQHTTASMSAGAAQQAASAQPAAAPLSQASPSSTPDAAQAHGVKGSPGSVVSAAYANTSTTVSVAIKLVPKVHHGQHEAKILNALHGNQRAAPHAVRCWHSRPLLVQSSADAGASFRQRVWMVVTEQLANVGDLFHTISVSSPDVKLLLLRRTLEFLQVRHTPRMSGRPLIHLAPFPPTVHRRPSKHGTAQATCTLTSSPATSASQAVVR